MTPRARYRDELVLIAATGADKRDERVAEAFACVGHPLRKPLTARVLLNVLQPLK